MICITAVCIFMHFSVVHVLPEIPFMARAETKVVSLSRRQWPRQKHNAILSKFETAAAFSIALASKSSNEQLLSKDCHNVRQHNSVCLAMWIVEGPAKNLHHKEQINTSKTIKALKSNLNTKMIQTRTFGISVRRNRRSRLL